MLALFIIAIFDTSKVFIFAFAYKVIVVGLAVFLYLLNQAFFSFLLISFALFTFIFVPFTFIIFF